jgi:GT2 family glycosyltransferase
MTSTRDGRLLPLQIAVKPDRRLERVFHGGESQMSVCIPTIGRDAVLCDTLRGILDQSLAASEVLVLDQSPSHDEATTAALSAWERAGRIRWLRLDAASQPAAMNRGLIEARFPLVLYLDDDIIPSRDLIRAHCDAYDQDDVWAVVGQVLQPDQEPEHIRDANRGCGLTADLEFPFRSTVRARVRNCMSGNLSVRRDRALKAGGFDENFTRVAYRFDSDFARRLIRAGGYLAFEPRASIRHLRAARGGTRIFRNHLQSHRPDHSVGDYYFAMRHGTPFEAAGYMSRRLLRSVTTWYHLKHPWWIVPKLVGELRGLLWAMRMSRRGPALLSGRAAGASQAGQPGACD